MYRYKCKHNSKCDRDEVCAFFSQAEDAYVEFGNVLVGSSGTKTFNICNDGDCLLKYRLTVNQKVEGNSADQQVAAGR